MANANEVQNALYNQLILFLSICSFVALAASSCVIVYIRPVAVVGLTVVRMSRLLIIRTSG